MPMRQIQKHYVVATACVTEGTLIGYKESSCVEPIQSI
jgi:hypothetical protein